MNEQPDLSFVFFLGALLGGLITGLVLIFFLSSSAFKLQSEVYALKCEKLGGKIISQYNMCVKDDMELIIK